MKLFIYLTCGIVIFWISSVLASFVHKKTDNGVLFVATWVFSAYLLFELTLILANNLNP